MFFWVVVSNICAWNSKQPVFYGCFNWMIQNLYMGNGCFTKHPFINACLEFQVIFISYLRNWSKLMIESYFSNGWFNHQVPTFFQWFSGDSGLFKGGEVWNDPRVTREVGCLANPQVTGEFFFFGPHEKNTPENLKTDLKWGGWRLGFV